MESVEACSTEIQAWKLQEVKGISKAHALVPCHELKIRETSCFNNCCYGNDGNFHPTCQGWVTTGIVLEENEDRDLSDEREISTTAEREAMNVADEREVITATEDSGEEANMTMEGIMDMDNITVGSYIAVVYGRRWYIGRVEREVDNMYDVTYMAPSRGKWKWGRTDKGLVDKADISLCMWRSLRQLAMEYCLTLPHMKSN